MSHSITESCIGCTLCAKNCPVGAVHGTLKQQHTINPKRCVDCGVCGRVCAKGAILDQNGNPVSRVPKQQWKKPVVETVRCSACSMCVDICSFGCLAISRPREKGDLEVYAVLTLPEKCVGCALCEGTCPLHAISMKEAKTHESASA